MNTFALDKNYDQLNFEEISVEDLAIISGGSGTYAGAAFASATAFGIGTTSMGASWGFVAVGAAFAASPVVVVALLGLAGFAGYQAASAALNS